DGAQRGAALSGGAETGEQRTLYGQIKVRARCDEKRVLAAQLQARGLQITPGQRTNLAADCRRACEADLVEQPCLQRLLQSGEGRGTVGVDDIEHPVRKPAPSDEETAERCAADR